MEQQLATVIAPSEDSKRAINLSDIIELEQISKRTKSEHDSSKDVNVMLEAKPFDWDKWYVNKFLGKGAFGSVWKITNRETAQVMAMKFFPQSFIPYMEKEAMTMAVLSQSCPELVQYKGIYKTHYTPVPGTDQMEREDNYALLMEWVPGPDLYQQVKSNIQPDLITFYNVSLQLLHQLACIHSVGVVHGDLSSRNIIYDGKIAKLIDYGFGCAYGKQAINMDIYVNCVFNEGGTPLYRAPEVWEQKGTVSPASDIFSLGMVLAEWFLANINWFWSSTATFPSEKFVQHVELNKKIPNYVKTMLSLNPADRPTAAQLIPTVRRLFNSAFHNQR